MLWAKPGAEWGLDLALFLATTIFFMIPALLIGGIYWGMVGVAFGVAASKFFSIAVRQLLLDRFVGSTLPGVLKLLGLNLLSQLPIVAIWWLGLVFWPTGSWLRDATLAMLCLAGYGVNVAATVLPASERLKVTARLKSLWN